MRRTAWGGIAALVMMTVACGARERGADTAALKGGDSLPAAPPMGVVAETLPANLAPSAPTPPATPGKLPGNAPGPAPDPRDITEPAPGLKQEIAPDDGRVRRAPGIPQKPVPARPGPPAPERHEVARLEAEARSLAKAAGCTSAGECRAAPVGSRACGGPRTYLVYCRTTTDSAALMRVLTRLELAERAANERTGMASTCDFRMPPDLAVQGGRCVSR